MAPTWGTKRVTTKCDLAHRTHLLRAAPAAPIKRVSRIPQKQSSVLLSQTELKQSTPKEEAVNPELQVPCLRRI